MVTDKATVFDGVRNVFNNYLLIHFISSTFSSGSEVCNPLLQKLTTFYAKIIKKLFSESGKRHFWAPKLQNVSGRACPRPPSKECLHRSIANRASNTTLGTPLCKNAGYVPEMDMVWTSNSCKHSTHSHLQPSSHLKLACKLFLWIFVWSSGKWSKLQGVCDKGHLLLLHIKRLIG